MSLLSEDDEQLFRVVFAQPPHHPPSAGEGMAYQRQSRAPVRTSYAVTLPRVGNSPPAVPTSRTPKSPAAFLKSSRAT